MQEYDDVCRSSNLGNLLPKACDRARSEIANCQQRITQVFVPTIIGFSISALGGIMAVPFGSAKSNIGMEVFILLFLFSFFSVFISSSIYIMSLSYKIFRNAAFLKECSTDDDWENLLKDYNTSIKSKAFHKLMELETTAIGLVYSILSIVYCMLIYYFLWGYRENILRIFGQVITMKTYPYVALIFVIIFFTILFRCICYPLLTMPWKFAAEMEKRIHAMKLTRNY